MLQGEISKFLDFFVGNFFTFYFFSRTKRSRSNKFLMILIATDLGYLPLFLSFRESVPLTR